LKIDPGRITDDSLKYSHQKDLQLYDSMYKTGVLEVIFPELANLAGVDQRKDFTIKMFSSIHVSGGKYSR